MPNTVYNTAQDSIFEPDTIPEILYVHHFGNPDDPKPSQALHTHTDAAELIFIEEGTCKYMVDHQKYEAKAGDLILLNSNILHGLSLTDEAYPKLYEIGISKLQIKGLESLQIIDSKLCPLVSAKKRLPIIKDYIHMLASIAGDQEYETIKEAGSSLTVSLLVYIHKLLLAESSASEGSQDYNLGLRIKEFIDAHYLEDLKLADIAAALHVNAYYLSHTFKKIIGYSPIQYMIHRRIGEAQNLLINSDYSITEIALRCGYNNSNYFQVVFNSIVGMPPGKYRKSWRQS